VVEASLSLGVANEIGYGMGVGLIFFGLIGLVVIKKLVTKAMMAFVLFALAAFVLYEKWDIRPSDTSCTGQFFWAHVVATPTECHRIKTGG